MPLLADEQIHDDDHQDEHSERDDHEWQGDDSRRCEHKQGSSNLRRVLYADSFEQSNVSSADEAEDESQLAARREQVVLCPRVPARGGSSEAWIM